MRRFWLSHNYPRNLLPVKMTSQGPDQVRQFHETSIDDGKTWVTTYDFTYKRKK